MRPWTGHTLDDVTAAVVTLERRFPGASVWFGQHTSRWWALMPWAAWWLLLEGATPMELADRMTEARGSAAL
ncbi:hypothetical protein E1281_12985 [Actinomadura sp. KC345]|uniref:hypothetical protein n=1 Tax=Actinomadura sp. KC345 TaxID=2530371 RepID=UPI00104FEDEF|nr:hypothetical protein [Actinomadura sp. KC345]TDC55349.1 hypothetical protein E1281_12985 [Actinomadura sp. KC345]